MNEIGRYLIIAGICIAAVGMVLLLAGKMPFLGRLPGDIILKKGDSVFYFPVTTCILISTIISLISYFFGKK
ncbi:MAG TPA: DUF2905 domain-containing protein [Candidatus Omnitrophota bacterium]|nr:DUF2905 domain-containing protein [Candidatus Omnitrophota bacterium]HPS20210.1 DUF2905 domain-containing protein [Candidatus Omnitrophota bacterium]